MKLCRAELGGNCEAVVDGGVSQVVQQVVDRALACKNPGTRFSYLTTHVVECNIVIPRVSEGVKTLKCQAMRSICSPQTCMM